MGRAHAPIWVADEAAALLRRPAPIEMPEAGTVDAMLDDLCGGIDTERQLIASEGPARGWIVATDPQGLVRLVAVRNDLPRGGQLRRPEPQRTIHTACLAAPSAHRIEPLPRTVGGCADVFGGGADAIARLFTTRRGGDVVAAAAVLQDSSVVHASTTMVRRLLRPPHVDQVWWRGEQELARSVIVRSRWHMDRWGVRFSIGCPDVAKIAVLAILVRGQYVDWYPD